MIDINYIRNLSKYFNDNPLLDFDSRTRILYPLLDEIFVEGELLEVELRNGLILKYAYRSNIAKEILLRDEEVPSHAWEPMTSKAVELAVRHRPGPVLIGGAYFGDHAMVAALELKVSDSHWQVVCVEPNNQQRKLLLENAKNNNLSLFVRVVDGVLWKESGARFSLADSDSHACATADESSDLISSTIDELLSEYGQVNPCLILLDIEGSELDALQGAAKALSLPMQDAPVVIVEIHKQYVDWTNGLRDTELVQILEKAGYHIYALRDCQSNWELGLTSPEIIPLETVYLQGPPHGFNLIASKDQSFFDDNGFRLVTNVSPKYLRHRDPSLHLPIPT